MFVCLLIGKVWGWIGEGRVEILEQQPPSNPRLFHARLSFSLIISTLFDIFMLRYSINTVLLHARPNMMVMFAFEFAVLTITSISAAARYTISLREAAVIQNQIKDRRAQIRRERVSAHGEPTADGSTSSVSHQGGIVTVDDIDLLDVDVPGWEEKGRWVFYLDLATGLKSRNCLSKSFKLTVDFQTSSSSSYTSHSSVCFVCFMACPFTLSETSLSQFVPSTSELQISSDTVKQPGT